MVIDKDMKRRMLHHFQNENIEELKKRKIYIWGVEQGARQVAMTLDEYGVDFEGFISDQKLMQKKRIKGYYDKKIYTSEEALSKFEPEALFVLFIRNQEAMIVRQILRHQYSTKHVLNLKRIFDVLNINNRCNLNCRFCTIHGENKTAELKNGDMTFETAKTAVDKLSSTGYEVTVCASGEPLLHKEFIPILSYAYQKYCITTVISNGLALDDHMVDQILEIGFQSIKVMNFSFSVTGYSEAIYNRFQGSGQADNRIRSKVYSNIEHFLRKRDAKGISNELLRIGTTYILSADEDNYQDLKEYILYWKGDTLDSIYVSTERCYSSDYGSRGYEYKIDHNAKFLCRSIETRNVFSDGTIGMCCESGTGKEAMIGHVSHDIGQINKVQKKAKEQALLSGEWPSFCRICYQRNTYGLGFDHGAFVCMLDHIDLIKNFFNNKKRVLFYGLNEYQRALYTIVKGEGIIDRDNIVIVDAEADGYFHDKKILRPTLENLQDQDMIVFDEESFMQLEIDIINSLHSWVGYRDFI